MSHWLIIWSYSPRRYHVRLHIHMNSNVARSYCSIAHWCRTSWLVVTISSWYGRPWWWVYFRPIADTTWLFKGHVFTSHYINRNVFNNARVSVTLFDRLIGLVGVFMFIDGLELFGNIERVDSLGRSKWVFLIVIIRIVIILGIWGEGIQPWRRIVWILCIWYRNLDFFTLLFLIFVLITKLYFFYNIRFFFKLSIRKWLILYILYLTFLIDYLI